MPRRPRRVEKKSEAIQLQEAPRPPRLGKGFQPPRWRPTPPLAQEIKSELQAMVGAGLLPESEFEKVYAVRLIDVIKRIAITDPTIEDEFNRLLAIVAKNTIGVEPPPAPREYTAEIMVSKIIEWIQKIVEESSETAERLGVSSAIYESEKRRRIESLAYSIVTRAAETVISWYLPW